MLENILIKYFNLKEDWNDDAEKAKELWNNAYDELIGLIYKLDDLGCLQGDFVCDSLDIINGSEE